MKKILLYGFGNIGRQDDGLGILFIERMEEIFRNSSIKSIDFESNYQLNIEDAHTISQYDVVIFADASVNQMNEVEISKVMASSKTEFTMHAMDPSFILHLCSSLYGITPETYLLTMRGSEFEFGQPITEEAAKCLDTAIELLFRQLSEIAGEEFEIDYTSETITLNR